MTLHQENINTLWGSLIIEELIRNGISHFFISPGSRSTPLTVAAARHPQAKQVVCMDERGAAFQAVGFGRGSGGPAALIATSGTAVANCYPAVIEASMDLVPLIILSADRPPELRQTGANQTIMQPGLFGEYVRWAFDMPCPDEKIPPAMPLTTIDQAVYRARRSPVGPVHVNCMFREPLAPVPENIKKEYLKELGAWKDGATPYTRYIPSAMYPEGSCMDAIHEVIRTMQRGLLVAGRLHSPQDAEAVSQCAKRLGWPIFADIASGMRIGNHSDDQLIVYFEQILLCEELCNRLRPEVILHLGGQVTSKRFLHYTDKIPLKDYIAVKDHPFRHDPVHRVTWRVESDLKHFCASIGQTRESHVDGGWVKQLRDKSRIVGEIIDGFCKRTSTVSEIAMARLISRNIPPGHGLFLASSMPIREMDMYADPGGERVAVGSNRGASGIDGTIASAVGFARGLGQPVTLLIGDLAFIHDLNSLLLLQSASEPVIIVIINNNGGGIFSFLPIAQFPDVFEGFFGTPHGLAFEHAARLFGMPYSSPATCIDFINAYREALERHVSAIIEIRTTREENRRLHEKLQQEIVAALAGT